MKGINKLTSGSFQEVAEDSVVFNAKGALYTVKKAVEYFELAMSSVAHTEAQDREPLDAYGITDPMDAETVMLHRVAILGPDEAGTAILTELLNSEDRKLFESRAILNENVPASDMLKRFRPTCNVEEGKYPQLVKRLLRSGIIVLLGEKDNVIENGIFAVPKTRQEGAEQRLIWDGRRSNLFFRDEFSAISLPSPDQIAELLVPQHCSLHVSKSDLSQMYNRLRVPSWLWRYFGLPKIKASELGTTEDDTVFFPALTVVPMGWKLAVRFAQQAQVEWLYRAGVDPRQVMIRGSFDQNAYPNGPFFAPYLH